MIEKKIRLATHEEVESKISKESIGVKNGVAGLDENGKIPATQLPSDVGSDMTGATSTENGTHGLVPAPKAGDEKKALLGDGTWGTVDEIYTFKTEEEYNQAVENDEIPDGAKVIKEWDETFSLITVDDEMSNSSENPVQNKVVNKYIDEKISELTKTIEEAKALRATLQSYGMVKLTDSTAVTDSTGLALPATEKNASIEGTIANQISKLNSDKLSKVGQLPQYTFRFGSYDGMVSGDEFENIKALRKIKPDCFYRGSIINIERSPNTYAYDTFIIGSTDQSYFIAFCLSFYRKPYFIMYNGTSGWSNRQYLVLSETTT